MSGPKRKLQKERSRWLWLTLVLVCLLAVCWYGYHLWYDYEIGPRYDIPYVSRRLDLPKKPVAVEPWVRAKPCYPSPTQERLPLFRKNKRYVIAVSIDGLRSDALTKLGPKRLPTFFRLKREGASTLNARTDHDYTITLPNHIAMMTGRFVLGKGGHGYTHNKMPGLTIHQVKGGYVPSIFDWLHDRGLRTLMLASKRKFILFPLSYGEKNGAPDRLKPDHGRKKIDYHVIRRRDEPTIAAALQLIPRMLPHFTFIHLRGPDTRGHWRRWMSEAYLDEVVRQDLHLKRLMRCIEGTPVLRGRTTLLVTTDHGGSGFRHSRNSSLLHYRIPWFAWGKGVARGADLYALNRGVRVDPGRRRIPRGAPMQPIRNGDIANVVARLLGLPAMEGSQIGRTKPLRLR